MPGISSVALVIVIAIAAVGSVTMSAAQPQGAARVALRVVGGDPLAEALSVDRLAWARFRRLRRVALLSHARAEIDAEVNRRRKEATRRRLLETNRALQSERDGLAAKLEDLR